MQLRDPRGPAHPDRHGPGLHSARDQGQDQPEAQHQPLIPPEIQNLPPVARRGQETRTLLAQAETISAHIQVICRPEAHQESATKLNVTEP